MTKHQIGKLPNIDWSQNRSRELATRRMCDDIHEVAATLGVSDRTIKTWVQKNIMPPRLKIGRKKMFFRKDIEVLASALARSISSMGSKP
jgi:predicted DNA-binding transcriptional regulator AlpA